MTPQQRLMNALEAKPVDQTPVWLLFPYHPTGYYVDVRSHPDYRRVFDYSREQGVIMLNRRNLSVRLLSPEVSCRDEVLASDRGPIRRRVLSHGGMTVYADQVQASGEPCKKLLASAEDLECYCTFPIEDDEATINAAMEAQLGPYLQEKAEFPPEFGSMMLDLGSPVNHLYHAADLEEYSIWSITHADLVVDWLGRAMKHLECVYRFCLERDLADVYFLVGSELASPPLVSRETFQKWVVPFEGRLIELIHSYGKKVIQHYHGQIHEVLPDFVAMKPDGLHTIEAPPVGNCTLTQAYEATQAGITLIGNIQYDEFRSTTPAEMRRRVVETLDEVAGRRFILSPTAGPFDPHPSPRLIENYLAFIDAASDYSFSR